MPFKDSEEGQTHSFNDGCGCEAHNPKPPIEKISKCCHAPVTFEPNPFCHKCGKICETIDSMPVTVNEVKYRIPFDEEPTQGEEFDWEEIDQKWNKEFPRDMSVNTRFKFFEFMFNNCVPRKEWDQMMIHWGLQQEGIKNTNKQLTTANQEIAELERKNEELCKGLTNYVTDLISDPERQKLAIKHAAELEALDQEITPLKAKLADYDHAISKLIEQIHATETKLAEAEKTIEAVREWAEQTMTNDGGMERQCFVNGYQYGQMEIRAILTSSPKEEKKSL